MESIISVSISSDGLSATVILQNAPTDDYDTVLDHTGVTVNITTGGTARTIQSTALGTFSNFGGGFQQVVATLASAVEAGEGGTASIAADSIQASAGPTNNAAAGPANINSNTSTVDPVPSATADWDSVEFGHSTPAGPPNIVTDPQGWEDWWDEWGTLRKARAPVDPDEMHLDGANKIYIAYGIGGGGAGTEEDPYLARDIGEIAALVTTHRDAGAFGKWGNGNTSFYLKAGDEFARASGNGNGTLDDTITLDRLRMSISSYGLPEGATKFDYPMICGFDEEYPDTGWTEDSTDGVWFRTETTEVTWVVKGQFGSTDWETQIDEGGMAEADDLADVRTRANSWWYDSGNTRLYVNTGDGTNAPDNIRPSKAGGASCDGIQIASNGSLARVHQIGLLGLGCMDAPSANNGWPIRVTGNSIESVMTDCLLAFGPWHLAFCNAGNTDTKAFIEDNYFANIKDGVGSSGKGWVVVNHQQTSDNTAEFVNHRNTWGPASLDTPNQRAVQEDIPIGVSRAYGTHNSGGTTIRWAVSYRNTIEDHERAAGNFFSQGNVATPTDESDPTDYANFHAFNTASQASCGSDGAHSGLYTGLHYGNDYYLTIANDTAGNLANTVLSQLGSSETKCLWCNNVFIFDFRTHGENYATTVGLFLNTNTTNSAKQLANSHFVHNHLTFICADGATMAQPSRNGMAHQWSGHQDTEWYNNILTFVYEDGETNTYNWNFHEENVSGGSYPGGIEGVAHNHAGGARSVNGEVVLADAWAKNQRPESGSDLVTNVQSIAANITPAKDYRGRTHEAAVIGPYAIASGVLARGRSRANAHRNRRGGDRPARRGS